MGSHKGRLQFGHLLWSGHSNTIVGAHGKPFSCMDIANRQVRILTTTKLDKHSPYGAN